MESAAADAVAARRGRREGGRARVLWARGGGWHPAAGDGRGGEGGEGEVLEEEEGGDLEEKYGVCAAGGDCLDSRVRGWGVAEGTALAERYVSIWTSGSVWF